MAKSKGAPTAGVEVVGTAPKSQKNTGSYTTKAGTKKAPPTPAKPINNRYGRAAKVIIPEGEAIDIAKLTREALSPAQRDIASTISKALPQRCARQTCCRKRQSIRKRPRRLVSLPRL